MDAVTMVDAGDDLDYWSESERVSESVFTA